MPRATIVHVITLLELGGAQEITLLTCGALDRERYDVHLVTGRGGLLDREAEAIPELSVHFLADLVREIRPAADARALAALVRLLRDLRHRSSGPLLVHTHSSKAGILGRIAARLSRTGATVHSIHGFAFHERQRPTVRRAYQNLERLVAAATDAFTADSRANLEVAERLGLLRGDKPALFMPPGIDPQEYQPIEGERERIREELGIGRETPLVGTLACLKPQKAPLDLVRVAVRVGERVPEAHFFLAGDGELRREMEEEIAAAGLGRRFHLLGWRRDVRALLSACDVFALTSLHEGLPRAILQALAAGKPIVASHVDGIPEAVTEGQNGHLLEPRDVAGFAERIASLLADPAHARALGAESARRAGAFDWRRGLADLDALYGRLLSCRRSSRAA
jgi:glycosyltransferase involved in cell wall biosynthesis